MFQVKNANISADRPIGSWILLAFVLLFAVLPGGAGADESGKQRVLLLYYDNQGSVSGLVEAFDRGLRSAFGERDSGQIELNVEYTDLSRNSSRTYQDRLLSLFKLKYGETPPDLIIANMDPYSDFLVTLSNDLFPRAKIVFSFYDAAFLEVLDRFPGKATGAYIETGSEDSPDLIQRVLPETENIFVVGGASPIERNHVQRVMDLFNAHADRFNINYLIGTPVAEILDTVSALPAHSVIYFTAYLADNSGKPYLSYDVLTQISSHANAPIFSFNDMYMGFGVLGGEMISSEETGKTIAKLALRILEGEDPGEIEPFLMAGQYMFDWKQLRKWNIDEKRLPPGSIIRDREYSFFEKYRWRIIFWAGVMVLQFFLITHLVVTLALRKRAEKERSRLEAALHQAQKMESIGTLAGGIAHDFNNILSAILGYTELTLLDMKKGTQEESNLQEVLKGGRRAKDLVNQILTFARKAQEETALVHIRSVAEEALKLLRSTIPSSIEIRKNLTSDSEILADRTRIHQIFINICTNAVHAMRNEAGTLSVDVSDVTLVSDDLLPPGEYVKIWISDTGTGIAGEHLGQIFDPYFTTKEAGKGTGLGLSVVLGIVEGYGGKVTVDSRLHRGTAFTIFLPISKSGPRAQPSEQAPIQRGVERVLFVDDEPAILEMGKLFLERQGYQVTCAADGVEALERFKEGPERFDIVVTDMTMPRMNGDMLAVELGKLREDIPVILCTGYSKKVVAGDIDRHRIKAVLMKPVSHNELAETIRHALRKSQAAAI